MHQCIYFFNIENFKCLIEMRDSNNIDNIHVLVIENYYNLMLNYFSVRKYVNSTRNVCMFYVLVSSSYFSFILKCISSP